MGVECNLWQLSNEEVEQFTSMSGDDFTDYIFNVHPCDFDLEKMWDMMHYLYCGTVELHPLPAGFIKSNGTITGHWQGNMGEEDEGFRCFSQTETKRIADFLDTLDLVTLQSRYDPVKMFDEEVYGFCEDEDEDELPEEFITWHEEIQKFFRAAAHSGLSVGILFV